MVTMNARTGARTLLAVSLTLGFITLSASPASAEDLRGRWFLGGNLSFLSTIDDIRNNASIIFTDQFGDDGIPFTGDPNEVQGCGEFGSGQFFPSTNPFCDPRPDDLLARDNQLEETFYGQLTAGYGFSSWLSVQLDIGYFEGEVGPIDVFIRSAVPVAGNPLQPDLLTSLQDRQISLPTIGGDLTEVPVTLSAIVRFRKDSPLNPYIGAGAGVVYTDFDASSEINALNKRLSELRIRGAGDQFGVEVTPPEFSPLKPSGDVPFVWPVKIEVEDAFQWHLNGGAEYFFNDRFSLQFDARYAFVDQDVTIRLGPEKQVDFLIFPEELFREDGSVQIFNPNGGTWNPTCAEAIANSMTNPSYRPQDWGCDPQTASPSDRIRPAGGQGGTFKCPGVRDFDGDGRSDQCYTPGIISPNGARAPTAFFVVQGGEIDMTAFSLSIGARFHF